MEPIIKTENLSIVFDQGTIKENPVLRDVNIEIFPGEYVILFGPSGSGKSTLLYHLAGLDNQTRGGKIFIDGIDILSLNSQELLQVRKAKMGMVFQAYNLISTIKIINNVCLPLFFHSKNNKESIKQGEKYLDALGVLSQKDKLPPALSGGQQQRVAIARALITEPAIIFADEPVGNLDFKSAYDVLSILSDLNLKQKKTIVFVTHDMNYLQFADKIIYIWDGKISKVELNRHKITPQEKFGDINKLKISEFTRRLANSLVSFILEGEEKSILGERISQKLVEFLNHEMSWDELISFFSSPLKVGGLGFSYVRVKKIEEVLKKMRIQNNLLFFKYFHKIDKNDIVDMICQEVVYALDAFQKQKLADIIEFRINNIVTEENIFKFLVAPIKEKGLNMPAKQAEEFNEKIHIFLDLLNTVKSSEAESKTADEKKLNGNNAVGSAAQSGFGQNNAISEQQPSIAHSQSRLLGFFKRDKSSNNKPKKSKLKWLILLLLIISVIFSIWVTYTYFLPTNKKAEVKKQQFTIEENQAKLPDVSNGNSVINANTNDIPPAVIDQSPVNNISTDSAQFGSVVEPNVTDNVNNNSTVNAN